MPDHLPPLNALKAFEVAARHLSLKRAAADLHVTPAAISHQIKSLEDYVGVKLFERKHRGLQLTAVARAALPKLRMGFEALAQAVAQMQPDQGSDRLSVSVAPSFAARWLMPRLHRFFAAYPEVDVAISARTRTLNREGHDKAIEQATVERWLSESDVAILYGHGDYSGFLASKLFSLTIAPLCSPQLAGGEHPLRVPADLRHHTLVHDDTGLRYDGSAFWDVWLSAAAVVGIETNRGPHFNQPVLAIEAAVDSLGIVATFPIFASEELATGRLILPFSTKARLQSGYYLVFSEVSALKPGVAAFRDWVMAEAAQQQ